MTDPGGAATERVRAVGPPDPQATAELPRPDWSDASGAASAPAADWSTQPTQDFPAYRPQSYPTYPPTHAPTTELPAVGDGYPGSPESAGYTSPPMAAGYAGSSTATGYASSPVDLRHTDPDVSTAAKATKPRRRAGAGLAGALAVVGLGATVAGAFASPIQRFAQDQNAYFGNYRDLATHRTQPSGGNQHSISLVGGHLATDWWRFGLFTALGVVALLFLVMICIPVLRRVAGVLLFLGGLAAVAGFLLGAHQTNDYRSVTALGHATRVNWQHLAYGFWVAVGGCFVIALAGLVAAVQSTRR